MAEIDFMSSLHNLTKRDYLGRVNDKTFPKHVSAELAKKYAYDYWDGDRRICYGGYKYIEGRWENVARGLLHYYKLPDNPKILDVGCGKGFLLYDILKICPGAQVFGLDISDYALDNAKEEIKNCLSLGSATNLPWKDNEFDLVLSITTLHNLYAHDLDKALREIERVGKNKYVCVHCHTNC